MLNGLIVIGFVAIVCALFEGYWRLADWAVQQCPDWRDEGNRSVVILKALAYRGRQVVCGLTSRHEGSLLKYDGRLSLWCPHCHHESPGWEIRKRDQVA